MIYISEVATLTIIYHFETSIFETPFSSLIWRYPWVRFDGFFETFGTSLYDFPFTLA